jgi:hypothetical protein
MSSIRKNWFGIFIAIFIILIGFSFFRFWIQKDFVQYDFIPCNPEEHSCFVSECAEDDPRCNTVAVDGMFNFQVQKIDGDVSIDFYCSDETLEEFSNFVFDATCS